MEEKRAIRVQAISSVFATINIFLLLLSSGFALKIRHSFKQVFEDMGAELPLLSQAFLNFHWVIWILGTLIIAVLLLLKERIAKKRIPMIMNGAFFLMLIVFWMLFTTAMLTPVMTMTEQLNNG